MMAEISSSSAAWKRRRVLGCASLAAAQCITAHAAAQLSENPLEEVIPQACDIAKTDRQWNDHSPIPDADDANNEWVAIDRERLWYFAVARQGVVVAPNEARRKIEAALAGRPDPAASPEAMGQIAETIIALQNELADNNLDSLKLYDRDGAVVVGLPRDRVSFWIADQSGIVRCKVKKKEVGNGATTPTKKNWVIDLNLRETPETLHLTGEPRKTTGAAQLALERTRTFLDDGTRKQVTNLTGKGVLGLSLLPQTKSTSLFAYAGYEISRSRTKPSTPPVPPATVGDGDTRIFKLGLIGSQYFSLNGASADKSLVVGLDGAYLFDEVKDSERMRAKVTFAPYFDVPAKGPCGVRYFAETFIRGLYARCIPEVIFQFNEVTRDGKLKPEERKDFLLMGGRISYDVMLQQDLKAGVVAGGSYEYQKRFSGGVPSIERHRLYIKYRLWVGDRFAVDIGPELIDGINPDSFADENQLILKTGLIF